VAYTVVFTAAAAKSLAKLDRALVARIKPKVLALMDDPRPAGCVKLSGQKNLYRIRIGDYRVIYQVDDRQRAVEITVVADRRESYCGL
jgi:mRNA interferase RelE/StbE